MLEKSPAVTDLKKGEGTDREGGGDIYVALFPPCPLFPKATENSASKLTLKCYVTIVLLCLINPVCCDYPGIGCVGMFCLLHTYYDMPWFTS